MTIIDRFHYTVVFVYISPRVYTECSAEEFECANGFCVPLRAFCAGGDNCGDNSDDDPSTCQQIGTYIHSTTHVGVCVILYSVHQASSINNFI